MSKPPLIAIVDDDEAVRDALCDLLQVEGLEGRPFAHGAAFLADETAHECDCLVTDVRMPGIDGMELHYRLRMLGSPMPVIFITSSDDPAARALALQRGAVAWFTKPVADEALLTALWAALDGAPRPPRE